MDLQTTLTLGGLGTCSALLIAANWSSLKSWLPRASLFAGSKRARSNPAELIEAYHVARDACTDDADLAARTDQVFTELITRKVLRCEK